MRSLVASLPRDDKKGEGAGAPIPRREARVKRSYYVYILGSRSRVLYTGVTNDLERRVGEHRKKSHGKFTTRYYVRKLVYFEETDDIGVAIAREKEIKGWRRGKKVALVESVNPGWRDLAEKWEGS